MFPPRIAASPCHAPLAALVVVAAALALACLATPAGAAPAACPAASTVPASAASADRSEHALLCLINRERAHDGVRTLRANRCLARAAAGHASDMVRFRYFAHRSRDGGGFAARIMATGYATPRQRWVVGENLAWGAAPAGDPEWVLHAWLRSPGHRANLLRGDFRDVGVAAVHGAPVALEGDPSPRATYAVEFGVRSGPGGGCR